MAGHAIYAAFLKGTLTQQGYKDFQKTLNQIRSLPETREA